MTQLDEGEAGPFLTRESPDFVAAGPAIGIDDLPAIMWRWRWRFMAVAAAVALAGGLFMALAVPKYTAHATLMVATRQPDLSATDAVPHPELPQEPDVEGEIQLVTSRDTLEQIVRDLQLDRQAEPPGLIQRLGALAPQSARPDPVLVAMEGLAKHLAVGRIGRSTMIDVAFSSPDPAMAERVVNAVADGYIAKRHMVRVEEAKRAAEWLNERSTELRNDALTAERVVEEFRVKNALTNGRDIELLRAEMQTLNARIAEARVEQDLAASRLAVVEERVHRDGIVAAAAGPSESPGMQHLRDTLSSLRVKQASDEANWGPHHPQVLKLGAEAASAQAELEREARARLDSLRADLATATRHTTSLEASFQRLRASMEQLSGANLALRALERDVATSRTVYEAVLGRFKTTEQIGFNEAKTWIVSRAVAPMVPSSPKPLLVLGASLALALGFGLSAALLGERRASLTVGSGDQLTGYRGARGLGLLPRIGRRRKNPAALPKLVRDEPNSPYAEAIAVLRTSLTALEDPHASNTQVLLFCSAVAGEGKSTTVAALATLMRRIGRRVVVLDFDLRSPCQHTYFGIANRAGVADYLRGARELRELVRIDPETGVAVMTAGRKTPHPHDILHPTGIASLLAEMRTHFDVVLIDAPPMLGLSDARLLAPFADACVFVVRWRWTLRKSVNAALRQLVEAGGTLGGIVLSQVDPSQHATYHHGDSEPYRRAYRRAYRRGYRVADRAGRFLPLFRP